MKKWIKWEQELNFTYDNYHINFMMKEKTKTKTKKPLMMINPYSPYLLICELWKLAHDKHHNLNLLVVWQVVGKLT